MHDSVPIGRLARGLCMALGALLVVVFLPLSAQAQVPETPPLPETPQLPEPVAEAIDEATLLVFPVIAEIAILARPVATAAGFALRTPCAFIGSASFLVVFAGAAVAFPFPVSTYFGPVLIFCSGAFDEGPVDPMFAEVDAAAGDSVEDGVTPVLDEVSAALDPAKPELDEGCGVVRLLGTSPRELPPPLHRFDFVAVVCE